MIVIIGAGLAGLSAAYKLLCEAKLDPNDVLIVEARDKVGGRIESVKFEDGSRIDLGAQWLHGERSNPIYSWLKSLGLIEGPEMEESEFEGIFCTQLGQQAQREVVNRVLDLLQEAKSLLYSTAHTIDRHAKPVDIYRRYIETEAFKCDILKNADRDLIEAVERWFEHYETIDNSCEDISRLSIKAYSDWTDFDDGKMMLLRGGWQGVVDKLVEMIGSSRIALRHKVNRISFDDKGAEVVVSNGQGKQETYKSDHVIVTCSIGVLKTMGPDFFVPRLDETKFSCLSRIGFGVVNKIFLRFSEPFLQKEKGLKLLWVGCESCDTLRLPIWTKYITGFDLVTGAPNILMGWIGGCGAALMEDMSNYEVGQVCLKIFKIFLPNNKVPPLISATRSAWASEAHVRGAYSYPSVESVDDNVSTIWDPLCSLEPTESGTPKLVPRVLFAGEATCRNSYATAHGAVISGWREADRLINLKKSC